MNEIGLPSSNSDTIIPEPPDLMDQPLTPAPHDSGNAAARLAQLAALQPFGRDICETWREAEHEGHVPLHERVLEQLSALQGSERIMLLSAPRAGHGKTHLLGRVAAMLQKDVVPATLPWQTPGGATWEATGRGILDDLARGNLLQPLCGGVNAMLLRRLIQTGRIPSTDPAQALSVLGQSPMELFSPAGSARVIGEWFRKHFAQLSRTLADIANLDNVVAAEAWLRAMFEYLEKADAASLAVLQDLAAHDAVAQVPRFLRLAAVWKPVVLIADHMDAFYRDPGSGVALARFALDLAAIPGVHVVLSMNQDLWDTSFGPQLPSAFEDRLNARGVTLRGLTDKDAQAIVDLRLREAGLLDGERAAFAQFLDLERYFLGRPVGSVSPRALLRHASAQWRVFIQSGAAAMPATGATVPGGPIFDPGAEDELRQLAQSLAQEPSGQRVDIANAPAVPVNPVPPPMVSEVSTEPFLPDTPASPPSPPHAPPAAAVRPREADEQRASFQKLRQMLAKLRVATNTVPPPSASSAAPKLDENPAPAAPAPDGLPQDVVARYEELRRGLAQSPPPAMDCEALGALVRFAGRRFPVVRYDEVELPGLSGRSLPRWSLQGMEIVFGIEDFTDQRFWKTISSFVAGRIAELGAQAAQTGDTSPQLKLAVFKGDAETPALNALLADETIPGVIRQNLDVVHLDPRSLCQLHAMREVVGESESGTLHASGPSVLVALANELDFFWKRVTRPK
jgi:hypothetical protein